MTAQGKAALLELRDRLAKATGADRELDIAIAEFLGWRVMQERGGPRYWIDPATPSGAGILDPGYHLAFPPRFTASLDAAVILVPEECRDHWGVHVVGKDILATLGNLETTANVATPALALCLARIEYELAKEGQP